MQNSSHRSDPLLERHHQRVRRGRLNALLGIALLLCGYALLAIDPDTPQDWVLLRVATGFGLLFIGFALAILPWLHRISGGHAD